MVWKILTFTAIVVVIYHVLRKWWYGSTFLCICFSEINKCKIQSSAIITWSNIVRILTGTEAGCQSDAGSTKDTPASYGVCFVNICEEKDRVTMAPHCIGHFVQASMCLTHWGRDKMDAIPQMTFSSAFSWMKMFKFPLKFHWSFFLRVQITIFHHWFG